MKIAIKCYPAVQLERCKFVLKENKMTNIIDGELELDSYDDSDGPD